MAWHPPVEPPRAALVVARERRAARRQRVWDELNTVRVPMAAGLHVAPGTDGSAVAQTDTHGTIYTDGGVDDFTMAHEAAHNLQLTAADQQRFGRLMGTPKQPWAHIVTAGDKPHYEDTGQDERFANLVAMIATRQFPKAGQGGLLDGEPLTRRQILRFGRALERFGRRNGLSAYVRPS